MVKEPKRKVEVEIILGEISLFNKWLQKLSKISFSL